MKKKFCVALSAMLLAGSVPAYAAGWEKQETTHTFTATVGSMNFRKDGELQPLDVEIYIEGGYVMLPLRTFLTAVDENAAMTWDNAAKRAQVELGDREFSFDIAGNRIWAGGKLLEVSGEMEVKDGRVFVPLRNWGNILNEYGYVVGDGDIIWDAKGKTAMVRATEVTLVDGAEKLTFIGEGTKAKYAVKLTEKYDDIQSIGDGYFIAKKYVNDEGDLRGQPNDPANWQSDYFLLDKTGKVLQKYGSDEVFRVKDKEEGYLLVENRDGADFIIDREGNIQTEMPYIEMGDFSEGLALIIHPNEEKENAEIGFIDTEGKLVIPQQFYNADEFSEGLAAAAVHYPSEYVNGYWTRSRTLYGYIDISGAWVIEPKYWYAGDFTDGIARVSENGRIGYIDKEGNEIITPQYEWGSDFYNGKAFVQEKDGRVFLIDVKGKKLKQITDGQDVSHFCDGVVELEVSESVADGNVKYVSLYFDENGKISYEEAKLRAGLFEGLSAMKDEKTGKYGYVDENGVWIIAPAFDKAEPFEDGYAIVANEITLADGTVDVEWGIIQHPNP